jgi:hypothetical protein
MANYYSDPLRPARPGRIDAQVHLTPTYHGESLVPDYSKWMPGLADYDRLQRNRAMGVPWDNTVPRFLPCRSQHPRFLRHLQYPPRLVTARTASFLAAKHPFSPRQHPA